MVSGQQRIIIFCSFNTFLTLFLNFLFLKFLSFTGVICKDSTPWIPDSLSVDFGLRKPIVDGVLDSLSCFPDSKDQDSGFHKHKFSGSRIPLNGAIYMLISMAH